MRRPSPLSRSVSRCAADLAGRAVRRCARSLASPPSHPVSLCLVYKSVYQPGAGRAVEGSLDCALRRRTDGFTDHDRCARRAADHVCKRDDSDSGLRARPTYIPRPAVCSCSSPVLVVAAADYRGARGAKPGKASAAQAGSTSASLCAASERGVGVKRVVGDDAAQGLGGPGRIDFGQSQRCLKAVVGVVLVHGGVGFLCKICSGIRDGQPGWFTARPSGRAG
jgi:hypothetical protein